MVSITKCSTQEELEELQNFYTKFDAASTKGVLFYYSPEHIFFKVIVDGVLAGFGSVANDKNAHADFKRFLSPPFRRRGIGEMMLDLIINDARSMGKRWVNGSAKNLSDETIVFFEGKGFKVRCFSSDNAQEVFMLHMKLMAQE
jgi:GNAT superfamily N-acetyltransferase